MVDGGPGPTNMYPNLLMCIVPLNAILQGYLRTVPVP